MPISVDQYENLAGQVLSIYEEAEQKMVERVSRRLERGITQPGWTEKKYAEMYLMRNELAKINEQMIYDRKSITDDLVKTAYLKASQSFVNEARTYAEALHVDKYSPNVVKVINILTDLNNTMNVADRNILRRANDAYSDIVGRTSALMATGTITTRQAVQIELNRFANQGIGSFVDKAGRVWDMSTYAEMATLTAIERATIAGYTDTMQEYGYDLAQISNHFGACPICEAWEGVIISVTGNTPGYLSLSDAEGAGVFHPRCLHFISTYYEGFSPKGRTQPRAVTAPNIGYSARSKQRAFERAERMWKRRMAAAVSPEEERRAYAHVREYQDRIRELLGKYNAEQPLEVDHLFRKWYREGGRVTLSPEARRLVPYKIPQAWKPQPIDMAKLNAISTPNPSLPSEPKPHVVVQGKDITEIWTRDKVNYKFEIEDVIHAQGYDGLPRIVSGSEFDKAVQESHFIAQRTYSAPTQEIVNDYQNQLYYGKWYVDCSTGGAQYGQGMYCAADYNGNLTDGIREEMKHYQELNVSRGSPFAKTETFTLEKDAKIIKYNELRSMFDNYNKQYDYDTLMKNSMMDVFNDMGLSKVEIKDYEKMMKGYWYATTKKQIASYNEIKEILGYTTQDVSALAKTINQRYNVLTANRYTDIGSYAAALGYDAINAEGHGASDSYTVILNRTKVILKGE